MTHGSQLEARVAALISAMADSAPTDVDPLAMARLAATSRVGVTTRFGFMPGRLAFALLLLALASAIAGGAVIAGRFLQRDAADMLTTRAFVEPFTGLPPEGAAPSAPEEGELVVSFGGRVNTLRGDFHRMWLYADGRLLWKSNLEPSVIGGTSPWRQRFGGIEPTTAVIEQHLTSEGVELIRSEVFASAAVIGPRTLGEDTTEWSRPGVIWGALTLSDGDRLLDALWSDSRLPARLAHPGSWLPERVWADRRVGGYVPSNYAMCVWPSDRASRLDRLPDTVQALALANGTKVEGSGEPTGDCYAVTTDVARAIVAAFDAAGHPPALPRYVLPDATAPGGEITVDLLEITPNGEVICNCG